MPNSNKHDRTVRKAALPEVMHLEDVALALDVTLNDAEGLLRRGRVGPHITIRGRPAVLRTHFLAAIERHSSQHGGGSDLIRPSRPNPANGRPEGSGGDRDDS